MDVTQPSAAAAAPTRTQATGSAEQTDAKEKAKASISSDFETFLKMLTVQMQNQDPLNPMDSTEFAVQLATFSNVEQQVKTNDLLTAMSGQMNVVGMSQMAGWVGMDARTTNPVWFDGSPVELSPDPAAAADQMRLVVRNEDGVEVLRQELPASDAPISWAGKGANGQPLPEGAYSFELQSLSKGDTLRTDKLESYSRVVEARTEGGETMLVLQGGVKVAPEDITALRSPDA